MKLLSLLENTNKVFYRGVVDPAHAKNPFAGTRRGLPTFTDDWHVADVYAKNPNDTARDHGKSDQVYGYHLDIKKPLYVGHGESVVEANALIKQFGIKDVNEAWAMFQRLASLAPDWRIDDSHWLDNIHWPVNIEPFQNMPEKSYQSLSEIFVDHWSKNWPGLYCTSHRLADNEAFQDIVRKAGFDGIILIGPTNMPNGHADYVGDGSTSYDGIHGMEWRPMSPEQVTYLGPITGQVKEDEYTGSDIDRRRQMMRKNPVRDGMYVIYRACPENVTSFMPMDYVTMHKKFAIEHAQHMIAVEEEPYHIIKKMITQDSRNPVLFDAPNPGEYFYDGPELPGRSMVVPEYEW